MSQFLLSGLNTASFLLCGAFLAYVVLLVIPFLRHRPGPGGDPSAFYWHFLVPCLDEERVVTHTVSRLLADFPTAQVWCIDDASGDATPAMLARLAARQPRAHVVTRTRPDARQGKGPALNAGWQALRASLAPDIPPDRVLIGVLDADGRLDPACPARISGPRFFSDPSVGAVQVRVHIRPLTTDTDGGRWKRALARLVVQLQDVEFSGVIAAMELLRRHAGSVGMGGNGQFTRLSVLEGIADVHGAPWQDALIEDFELGLHVLLAGSRTEYCHDTWVDQEGLESIGKLVRQRSRWAQGVMQCLRYCAPVLRSRSISSAAALEILYYLVLPWVQLTGVVVYAASVGLLVDLMVTLPGGPGAWISSGTWGVFALFMIFGLAPLVVWGPVYRAKVAPGMSRRAALMLGLANWPYTYVNHAATWWAFFRVLRSRRDWKKTERVAGLPQPALGPLVLALNARFTIKTHHPDSPARVVVSGKFRPSLPEQRPTPWRTNVSKAA